MATNKSNFNSLLTELTRIQEQYPNLEIMGAQPIFTQELEDASNPDFDLEILGLHLTNVQPNGFVIWTIICCGSYANDYATHIAEGDPDLSVFLHDLQGTKDGMEIFNITIIAG